MIKSSDDLVHGAGMAGPCGFCGGAAQLFRVQGDQIGKLYCAAHAVLTAREINLNSSTEKRCSACQWVDETDSTAGKHFRGVDLCPLHAAAPELLSAAKLADRIPLLMAAISEATARLRDREHITVESEQISRRDRKEAQEEISEAIRAIRTAIAKAEGRS